MVVPEPLEFEPDQVPEVETQSGLLRPSAWWPVSFAALLAAECGPDGPEVRYFPGRDPMAACRPDDHVARDE